MPDVKGLVNDPEFQSLSPEEKRATLSGIDSEFSSLSNEDILKFEASMASSPKPEALSPLEQMLGGQILDPVTGERSQEEAQLALQESRIRGAQAQGAIDRQQALQSGGVPGAFAAGMTSVPQGIGELVKLALINSGMGTERQVGNLFPTDPIVGEAINEAASVSPVAAGLGSGTMNTLLMGRGGAAPVNLTRSIGALTRGDTELASQLLKQSLLEGGVGGGANIGFGEGIRSLTGSETTPGDVSLDLILGALTAGRRVDPQDLQALTRQPAVEGVPIQESLAGTPTIPSESPGVFSRMVKPIGDVVSRTKINMADAASQKQVIRDIAKEASSLIPVEGLETAVINAGDNGIIPRDIQLFTTSNPSEIKLLSKMASQAKGFSENRMASDPALIVGNEFTTRIKKLEEIKEKVGQDLGNFVKDIPSEGIGNTRIPVLLRLQSVPGLSGIKLQKNGMGLDFSDTSLSGSLTKSDRTELQSVFKDISKKSPLQLHRMRQEIFEVLGGKKSAKIQMTDTLDKGLEAIRQGLADSIEDISPEYRAANQRYAQVIQPLKDMRRFFRNVEGSSEDILDQKGALLGRRLTSNMQSSPELRDILSNMESQIVENGGKIDTDITKIQEYYNALSRYYDLTRDTSLAGQVRLGTGEIPTTVKGAALKKAKQLSGQTPAVQRKYLEDLINIISENVEE